MFKSSIFGLCLLVVSIGLARGDDAKPEGPYKVANTLQLGGEGRWDYITVDPETHRLYIPRSDHAMVVDATNGKVVGNVTGLKGAHGVAIVSSVGHGFATSGGDNQVIVFDLKTFETVAKVDTGKKPDGILYDAATNQVFVCANGGKQFSVIDPATNKVTCTIDLGGAPEQPVSDGAGKIYVVLEDTSEVAVIDAKNLNAQSKVTKYPIAPAEGPHGLAMDIKTRRLFVGAGNKTAVVMDADNGKVLAHFDVGAGVDFAGFDPDSGDAFIPGRDGTLTVIHEQDASTFTKLQAVTTPEGARTLALDTSTHLIYLPTAKFGKAAEGERRPPMIKDSFFIVVVGK